MLSLPAYARSSDDRASVGNDITIAEGETAGDVACLFCFVHVHGDVRGDVAVMFGKVEVDPGHTISGDVATLGADLNLGEGATVGGDVAIAAGDANLASGAMIHGSRMVLPGRLWLLVPVLLLWLSRLWLLASRGELHEDPVVYAITDKRSLLLGVIVVAIVLSAL